MEKVGNNFGLSKQSLRVACEFLKQNGFIKRLHNFVRNDLTTRPIGSVNDRNIILDLEIDLEDLSNFNVELHEAIVSSPQRCVALFQAAANAELLSNYAFTPMTCQLLVRTTKPPASETSQMDVKNGVLSHYTDHVLTAICVHNEHSSMLNKCFGEDCTERSHSDFRDSYLPETSNLTESCSESRRYLRAEKISLLFLDSKAFRFQIRASYTAIKCRLQEPLIKYLQLGCQYHVWGYYSFEYCDEAEFELLGLERVYPFSIPFGLDLLPSKIHRIRSSLEEKFPDNPWAFVSYLALQFGYEDWTLRSYLSFRMALLLSLATLAEKTPVSILGIGSLPVVAAKLMNEISKSAPRRISQCSSLRGAVSKVGNNIWIRSGKLTMGAFGVCLLGDWDALKRTEARDILHAISKKEVHLNTESAKLNRPVPKVLSLPLKTSIWTFLYYEDNNKHLQNLMSEFGIPFVVEPRATTLERFNSTSMESPDKPDLLSAEEMSQFLQYINSRTVDLTDEAVELINDYILTCRRTRGNTFPLCVTDTLTALAKGNARLSLREDVTYDDALLVVSLYEESWHYIYGNGRTTRVRESPRIYEQIEIFHKEMVAFKESLSGSML